MEKIDAILSELIEKIRGISDVFHGERSEFTFHFKDENSYRTFVLGEGHAEVVQRDRENPKCRISINSGDFVDMIEGKASPIYLFSSGKIKIGGEVSALLKIVSVL